MAADQQLNFTSCQQINTDYSATCERAMDGHSDQHFHNGSCTHTQPGSGNWWQAQLLQRAYIERIAIYNRLGCCSNRLNNFTVSVDGVECIRYMESGVFSVRNFSCGLVGQTVRIDKGQTNQLTLCDVIAYGKYFT